MTDDSEPEAPRRKWIPREAWRQEGAVRWVKSAVLQPHEFFGFDRSERQEDSHLWEDKRGVRKGCPDTLLRWNGPPLWFEFKAGNKKPDDDQRQFMNNLEALGDHTDWGYTIEQLWRFYKFHGVPMQRNAEFQALHYDGLVDSRIAKEEAKQVGLTPVKKKRTRKVEPRYAPGKRAYARGHAKGMW